MSSIGNHPFIVNRDELINALQVIRLRADMLRQAALDAGVDTAVADRHHEPLETAVLQIVEMVKAVDGE